MFDLLLYILYKLLRLPAYTKLNPTQQTTVQIMGPLITSNSAPDKQTPSGVILVFNLHKTAIVLSIEVMFPVTAKGIAFIHIRAALRCPFLPEAR
jgi:hypothetical protein